MAERADLSGEYDLDTAHTRLSLVARNALVTKVRDSFKEVEGSLHIDGEDPEKSSGQVRIVATSIDTGVAQRDEHLRSNDFFDMANFPEPAFRSSAVDCLDETTFEVIGDLTVKAVTRPITLDVEHSGTANDPMGNNRIGFEAAMTINRKD